MSVLHMFIDVAGDYEFKRTASTYLIWGATTLIDNPSVLYTPLSQLKHELNTNGIDIDRFHASEDRQWVRDKVFNILSNPQILFENDFVIVEKPKVPEPTRDLRILYPKMASYLLRQIFDRYRSVERTIIFTDRLPRGKEGKALAKVFKQTVKWLFGRRKRHIYHHPSASSFGLQAVDYSTWADFRKWERNDLRSYRLVQRKIKSELSIFESSTTLYY